MELGGLYKKSVCQFQRQESMDFVGMVLVSAQMTVHDAFNVPARVT